MVKLATAREGRLYGSGPTRERSEYTNAGLYLFSTVVLLCGFVSQFSREAKSGLVVLLIGFGLIILVNLHDLVAHLAAIDYQMRLMDLDPQFFFVEFMVPIIHAFGGLLFFIAVLFLVLQADRGFGYHGIEAHALHMLIAGSSLWVLGSIHNSCQFYEQTNGNIQVLQHCVQIPFLMGSLMLLVGAVLNFREQVGHSHHHGLDLLSYTWVWIGIIASSMLMIGGLTNVVKVVKMINMEGIVLEKLQGGAQEQLFHDEDGQIPFLVQGRRRRPTI